MKKLFAVAMMLVFDGGVAGCSDGRVVCGDGSLSPSCKCLKSDKDDDISS